MVANFATVKLASFGNRIAPSQQLNGTTGMEDTFAVSHDESSPRSDRLPEQTRGG